jgi:antitoxin VapB
MRLHGRDREIFMHGRRQAVRLPKEFRLPGKEVRVSEIGDEVIFEPLEKALFDIEAWRAELVAAGARTFLPEGLPEDEAPERKGNKRPDKRACSGNAES